ncbi:hypothetical protein [Nitrosomonas aestuarii]|uniref:hypothetical protein n=1 Tax=Nitrosomonas aestuarii TaxID=52441 RepID=UPI0011B23A73|nr:hypothetical protein [Nitrosomonas aestuarii]
MYFTHECERIHKPAFSVNDRCSYVEQKIVHLLSWPFLESKNATPGIAAMLHSLPIVHTEQLKNRGISGKKGRF